MKSICTLATGLVFAFVSTPSFAQKPIGKCMRADCASMQSYCEESRATGKTMTNCSAAGKLCLQSKGRTWIGTSPEGKKWSCVF
jgi:hypothetical protein